MNLTLFKSRGEDEGEDEGEEHLSSLDDLWPRRWSNEFQFLWHVKSLEDSDDLVI